MIPQTHSGSRERGSRPANAEQTRGRRSRVAYLLIAGAGLVAGCANYALDVPQPNFEATIHATSGTAYFWGLNEPRLVAEQCTGGPGAIGFVRARDNLGYDLLSVVTLGIVKPMKFEYRCAAARLSEGELEE